MAEDAEAAGEKLGALAVAFDVLVAQEPDRGLGNGQTYRRLGVRVLGRRLWRGGYHGHAPWAAGGECRGRRGSTAWSSQVPRSQACSGSSTIFQARSAPGPAITLR